MNEGTLTQKAELHSQAPGRTEFGATGDTLVLPNIPCSLDTLAAGSRMAQAQPGAMVQQISAVLYIVDPRLGRLPNRKFDEGNWFVIDTKLYSIAEIHEATNRLTGDLDHFEVYVYEGVNR